MFDKHDFYISGESYAGIYVPYLAKRVLDHNKRLEIRGEEEINLKGIIVGNGVTNWTVDGAPAHIEMSYYHGLYPKSLKDRIDIAQCDFREVPENYDARPECKEILGLFSNYTQYINYYDVYRAADDISTLEAAFRLQYTPWIISSMNREEAKRIL
jgi:carboxypeptidase C (cathepsin A)